MSRPRVAVVVLNWNGWRHTIRCLELLNRLSYPAFDIVVVDNGSSDGSEGRIREAFPEVKILQTGANLGFAGGNNAGIRSALEGGAELVWILNNDTEIPSNCLSALAAVMDKSPRAGILGPCVIDPSMRAPEPLNLFPPGLRPPRPAEPSGYAPEVELLDCAPGCSMLIRREVLLELGGFDPSYFHFFEDTDLCWRAWSAGWLVGRTSAVTIVHRAGSATSGARPLILYYMLRNLLLFAEKVTGQPVRVLLIRRPVLWLWALGPLFGLRSFGRPYIKLAVLHALVDATRGRSGRCSRYSPA
jgi:GT2 family glycosyltransferase